MILKQADKGQPMLYLIDGVFRGTNSLDRIAGAQVVLKELSKKNVIGLISTHDFELCDLNCLAYSKKSLPSAPFAISSSASASFTYRSMSPC